MKAVIFDIDGTLIESMAVDCDLYVSAIQSVIGPVRFRSRFSDYENVTDGGILEQVFIDNSLAIDLQAIDLIKTVFIARLDAHILGAGPFPVVDGALQFLEDLMQSASIHVAIATGGWRESAILKLEKSGFDLTRFPLASSDDSHFRVEIMSTALAMLDQDFDSITYFGDAEWDRKACGDLGWDFVAVGRELGGIESYNESELSGEWVRATT